MTNEELNVLKRRHNALQEEGQELWAKVQTLYEEVMSLRKVIEQEEGEDYDPIPLIFGSGFEIYDDEPTTA